MRFARPQMLWLLAIALPVLAGFLWWAWRRRNFLIAQFVRSRLLAQLTVGVSRTRQRLRMALLVLVVACVMLALARPQWGFSWEQARHRGRDIIVALDTSRSMLAQDVAPDRLARAKLAVLDLMRLARNDRLGLVAFAGTAFLQCPLTLDDDAFRQCVEAVDVGIIPQGGTAIAEAIDTALEAFKEKPDNDRALVILTDGEDHEHGVRAAARRAAQAGVRLFTIGVGTPEGDLLRQRDANGNYHFIKDLNGNVVKSRLNETLLREVARIGHGFYLPLRGAGAMELLYDRGLAPMRQTNLAERLIRRYHERFQWPLSLALVLLLLEMFLPERRIVRRPRQPLPATHTLGLARVILLGFALTFCPHAGQAASPRQALRLYRTGNYTEAQRAYEQLLKRKPNDPRLHFNAGAAAYQARRYPEAARRFEEALQAPDRPLQERAYYDLGNTFYRLGEQMPDLSRKTQAWEAATNGYATALQLDPRDADARFNLALVKRKLEQLKKQQPQEQSQSKPSPKSQSRQQRSGNPPERNRSQPSSPTSPQTRTDQEKKEHRQPTPSGAQKQRSAAAKPRAPAGNAAQPQPAPETGADASASNPPPGQMTRQQAEQLLEAEKQNEKALIFVPRQPQAPNHPIEKDW